MTITRVCMMCTDDLEHR